MKTHYSCAELTALTPEMVSQFQKAKEKQIAYIKTARLQLRSQIGAANQQSFGLLLGQLLESRRAAGMLLAPTEMPQEPASFFPSEQASAETTPLEVSP